MSWCVLPREMKADRCGERVRAEPVMAPCKDIPKAPGETRRRRLI